MSKQQVIEAIQRSNPSASGAFLEGFAQPSLESYLRRLTEVCGRRGRDSGWIREGETPAIVTRAH